jgi:hypothetical protein
MVTSDGQGREDSELSSPAKGHGPHGPMIPAALLRILESAEELIGVLAQVVHQPSGVGLLVGTESGRKAACAIRDRLKMIA